MAQMVTNSGGDGTAVDFHPLPAHAYGEQHDDEHTHENSNDQDKDGGRGLDRIRAWNHDNDVPVDPYANHTSHGA